MDNGRDFSSSINSNKRPEALQELQPLVTYRDLRLYTYVHKTYLTLFFRDIDPFSDDCVPAETQNSKMSTKDSVTFKRNKKSPHRCGNGNFGQRREHKPITATSF